MNNKKAKRLIGVAVVFVSLEAVMFCLIFFSGLPTNITSYLSICFCFAYALLTSGKSVDNILLSLGLLFTVGADTLLVLLINGNKVAAMSLFLSVQIIYLIRLALNSSVKLKKINIIAGISASIIAMILTFVTLKSSADALAVISVVYYALLLLNVIFAFFSFKKLPFFAIGLTLFAMCDLVIGFYFLGGYLAIPEGGIISKINALPFNLAWLFYLPAQVLIALSGRKKG